MDFDIFGIKFGSGDNERVGRRTTVEHVISKKEYCTTLY